MNHHKAHSTAQDETKHLSKSACTLVIGSCPGDSGYRLTEWTRLPTPSYLPAFLQPNLPVSSPRDHRSKEQFLFLPMYFQLIFREFSSLVDHTGDSLKGSTNVTSYMTCRQSDTLSSLQHIKRINSSPLAICCTIE